MINKDELIDLIKVAAKNCFTELREKHSEDSFCAFALYSDEGAMTVCPSANTKEYLEQKSEEDPDDALYYKWSTAEWKYEYTGNEWFSEVQKELEDFHKKSHTDEQFTEFQSILYESCVAALEDLKKEGFFKEGILVFSVTDYLDDDSEVSWIKRLNSKEEATEFKDWIEEQE